MPSLMDSTQRVPFITYLGRHHLAAHAQFVAQVLRRHKNYLDPGTINKPSLTSTSEWEIRPRISLGPSIVKFVRRPRKVHFHSRRL